MFNNIRWYDSLIAGGLILILLINPFVGQYIIQGIIWAYESLLMFTDIAISVGLTLIAIGFVAGKIASNTRANKRYGKLKTSKTSKAGKYIATQ